MRQKDYNIIPLIAFKQYWTQDTFSYMTNPRPDYGIMLVLSGQIDFVSPDGHTLCAKKGNVVFLPKNTYYEARFHPELGEISNYLINFETDRDINPTNPTLMSENASFECADLFRQFVDENYNTEEMNLRSKGLFYLLLDAILNENKTQKSTTDTIFEKAGILLEKDEDMPVSKIARECSVSESGLRKIFADKAGISPTKYRLNKKIAGAKYLLEATDMPIGEISDKLNFYDSAYFCRIFQKYTGRTPNQYRKNKKL